MDEIWVAFTKGGLKNTICFFRFVKGAMNIIDLLGILPYFMSLLLNLITVSGKIIIIRLWLLLCLLFGYDHFLRYKSVP